MFFFMSIESGATRSLFAKHFARLTLSCCQSHSARSTFPGNSPSGFSRLCTFIHVLTLRERLNTLQITFINWILYFLMLQNSYFSTRQLTCVLAQCLARTRPLHYLPLDQPTTTVCFWPLCTSLSFENREGLDRGQCCLFAGVF